MAEQESVYLWSNTAATNASADPAINFAEGQLPGTLNNSSRGAMAALAHFVKDTNSSLITGGTTNAYTLVINGRMTALATGHRLSFKSGSTNTGAATLAVTNSDSVSLGTKAIRAQGDVALIAGQIINNGRYDVIYDAAANGAAGAWILMSSLDLTFAPHWTNTTEATGAGTTASGIFSGGLEVLKKLFVTGIATFAAAIKTTDATNSTSTSTGSVQTAGGLGITKDIFAGGNLNLATVGGLVNCVGGTSLGGFGMGRATSVAAGATVNNLITRGLVFFGDETNGGTALVMYDGGTTPTIIAGSPNFTLTDPLAGGNKWYLTGSPTNGRAINRYASAVTLSYFVYGSASPTVV